MSRNPYLFVVGCARSGTTLLQRMLDHHPSLAVANEARFMLRIAENGVNAIDPPLTPELIEWVRSYHRFPKLGLSETAVSEAAAKAYTYGEFVSALYSEFGKLHGKVLAGEKSPQYVRFLPRLHALFPWVKTIHLIRDGRDVALSVLQWREDKGPGGKFQLWRQEPVAVCALWWERQVSAGRLDGAALAPERYHELRYEDLVNRSEKTLCDATEFLELPFAAEMLSYHEGKVRYGTRLSAKNAWLPPTPGLRDWRTQMKGRDVELFEAIAGDLLSTLGYERAFKAISPEIAKVAEQCRNWWETEMAVRTGRSGRTGLAKGSRVPIRSQSSRNQKHFMESAGMLGEARKNATTNLNQNPYVFIVGCPRSGTTLLERLVNAHSSIAMVPESHWILSWFGEGKGLTPEGFVIPALTSSLLDSLHFRRLGNRFTRLGISREELEGLGQSSKPLPYSTLVTGLFNLYGSAQGKPLVGQKTPGYGMRIRTLHDLWPTARFIHLIRDGRSVCLSAINWKRKQGSFTKHFPTWAEDPVSTAALWWESRVRGAREMGSSLGPNLYYEIRYESLVNNPAKECEALCAFLAVPHDDAMLRFHEGRIKTKPGLDAKHAWLPVTPGLRDWSRQMSTEDSERFEAVVGDLLEELGYPRAVRRLKPEVVEHASTIRNLFNQRHRLRNCRYEAQPLPLYQP